MSARADALAGSKAIAPLMLGIAPFALIAGVTAVEIGMTPVQAVAMSVVVFAGAAQLAAIELLGQTAPLAVVVLTAVVVNLRFVMYSASIAPYFRRIDPASTWLGAYVLTDQAYAVSVREFRETTPDERSRKWFYLGAAATLWVTWQVGTAVGAILGAGVPEGLSLEFAVPLTFLALLVPVVEDRPTLVAALVAGGVGIVAAPLPFNLGLVTAGLAGICAGVGLEKRAGRFPSTGDDGPARTGSAADADSGGASSDATAGGTDAETGGSSP